MKHSFGILRFPELPSIPKINIFLLSGTADVFEDGRCGFGYYLQRNFVAKSFLKYSFAPGATVSKQYNPDYFQVLSRAFG